MVSSTEAACGHDRGIRPEAVGGSTDMPIAKQPMPNVITHEDVQYKVPIEEQAGG